jgi:hypothetical protein
VGLYRLYKIYKCHTRKLTSAKYPLSKQNDSKGSANDQMKNSMIRQIVLLGLKRNAYKI